MKESFVLYTKYKRQFELLCDAERGALIMAVFAYVEGGEEPGFEGGLGMAFSFIRADLDADRKKWEATCQKRAEAGSKGGRPKNQMEAKKAIGFSEKQKKQIKAKKADGDSDCDCEGEGDSGNTRAYAAYYGGNIGKLPPGVEKEAEGFLARGMEDGAIALALKESVDAGAGNWRYARAVLSAWEKRGITTAAAAAAENTRGSPKKAFEQHVYTDGDVEERKEEALRVLEGL